MPVALNNYNTLIFDFGGVIFDIDPDLSRKQFANLFGYDKLQKLEKSGLFVQFEMGLISKEEMMHQVEEIVGQNNSTNLFIDAWNAMLIGYKPERIAWIKKLRQTHKLLMLSNTNALHFAHFSGILIKEYGVSLYDLFDHVFLSHEMHLIKPDVKIFEEVIHHQQLDVSKTLFIEDTQENANIAANLGIHTLVIPRNGTFYNYFAS